jgi:lipoate---protein ligase
VKYIDYTFEMPSQNLAFEEMLLDLCETGREDETLRFWEPPQFFVVLGWANRVNDEVDLQACQARNIPVLRRCSGGGTILQGPGCVNYALVLRLPEGSDIRDIGATNALILERHRQALEPLVGQSVHRRGTSDLALGSLKFSGNAQRRLKNTVLFHGTFLLKMDLSLMETVLRTPSRQPEYRESRSHRQFLTTAPLQRAPLKAALRGAWNAQEPLASWSQNEIDRRVQERYGQDAWNLKF